MGGDPLDLQPAGHPLRLRLDAAEQPQRRDAGSPIGAYFAWVLTLGGIGCLDKLAVISPWFMLAGALCIIGGGALGWRNRRCLLFTERREDFRKLYRSCS